MSRSRIIRCIECLRLLHKSLLSFTKCLNCWSPKLSFKFCLASLDVVICWSGQTLNNTKQVWRSLVIHKTSCIISCWFLWVWVTEFYIICAWPHERILSRFIIQFELFTSFIDCTAKELMTYVLFLQVFFWKVRRV